ncbi:Frataxin-like, mitochondrial [Holothuria leucospilota]|uniref:ferroxidase n=1 Tax=Holothuria leucospilota TaxID=206669 RepID=A0A9Q1BN19_HOLLE|nr:Frataxin-like, mitochondrial [Holothuria leucospilota]
MARVALLGQRVSHTFSGLKFFTHPATISRHTQFFWPVLCPRRDHQKYYHSFFATQYSHFVKCVDVKGLKQQSCHYFWKVMSQRLSTEQNGGLDHVTYEKFVGETLENLTEFFESLDELDGCPQEYDVQYSDGVLTVALGRQHGTYVINKQTPNKQIWLSSPTSGPKRYDFVNGRWIYSHDGKALHDLLNEELSAIFNQKLDFTLAEKDS